MLSLEAFAGAISFNYFLPDSGLRWYHYLNHHLARIGVSLEVANTRLPGYSVCQCWGMARFLLPLRYC